MAVVSPSTDIGPQKGMWAPVCRSPHLRREPSEDKQSGRGPSQRSQYRLQAAMRSERTANTKRHVKSFLDRCSGQQKHVKLDGLRTK